MVWDPRRKIYESHHPQRQDRRCEKLPTQTEADCPKNLCFLFRDWTAWWSAIKIPRDRRHISCARTLLREILEQKKCHFHEIQHQVRHIQKLFLLVWLEKLKLFRGSRTKKDLTWMNAIWTWSHSKTEQHHQLSPKDWKFRLPGLSTSCKNRHKNNQNKTIARLWSLKWQATDAKSKLTQPRKESPNWNLN